MSAVVGEIVAREHRGHPVEERGLGDRAGGRQQAVDGPLDPIGEGRRRRRQVVRVGQPPAARLDLDQAPLGRAAELVADERRAGARRRPSGRRDPRRHGVSGAPEVAAPSSPVAGVPFACVGVGSGTGVAGSGAAASVPFRPVAGLVSPLAAAPPLPGRSVAVANRRSCPARSSPTRISPSSRSERAGSPRARSVSTAASVTTRAVSAAENGLSSNPLRRREQAARRDHVRVAGAARQRLEPDVGARPRPRRQPARRARSARRRPAHRRPGRPGVRRAAGSPPRPRRGPSPRSPPDRRRRARRPGRRGRTRVRPPRGRPPIAVACRPRRAQRRAGEAVERQERGRLAAEDPRRRVIGGRQALEVRAHRRLAEDRAGSAASARSGRRRSGRRAGRRTRSGRSGRRRPSRRPRRGSAGPPRGAPGPGRARRRRAAG